MDRERHARIEDLFLRALDLAPEQRAAFLREHCGSDLDLLGEVGSLLAGHTTASDGLRPARIEVRDHDPTQIGPYRVIERIGEGGFAVVYAAEQREPVRRRVAVKVLRGGLESDAVLSRFEAERQALAVMDHPSIARVYDAGRTEDGRSFFVMEYVDGPSIVRYCEDHALSVRERIELMIPVCEAVQHAHQKGVIHRDLKPSNILVTEVDGRALPKVIDFGIAKATGLEGFEEAAFTRMGQFVGTPEYCSPEQACRGEIDIDTRTDVYSLGVVLYELLTGQLPFPRERLLRAGVEEVLRVLREDAPPRPSTRVNTIARTGNVTLPAIGADVRTLARRLRGELDWIVLRSLEKERERRYESAFGLADDLRRFLRGDPVAAGPPSVAYRARKFVRRHRVSVFASVGLLISLVAFGVVMAVQADRISHERDRANTEAETARRVAEFLTSLFEFSDPGNRRGRDVSARDLLDQGEARLETELEDQPLVRASLLVTLGQVYRRLDEDELAAHLLETAVELRSKHLGDRDLQTIIARGSLAIVYQQLGRYDEAEAMQRQAIADHVALRGADHPSTFRMQSSLALIYSETGRHEEALALYREVLAKRLRGLGEDHRDTHYARHFVGLELMELGRYEEAEPFVREALERLRVVRGSDHPNTLMVMGTLGRIDLHLGRVDEAVALFEESMAGQQLVHGVDSREAAQTRRWLEEAQRRRGAVRAAGDQ